jgi:hypothetical protein
MKAWDQFWFSPVRPEPLAIARIVLYGTLLALYGFDDLAFVPELAALRWKPLSIFAVIHPSGPPSATTIAALQWTWRVALVLGMIGFRARIAAIVAALLGLYLIGLPYNVSRLSHEAAAAVIALWVLVFAGAHRWPIRLMQVILSLAFFSAGLAKLRHSGLDWIAPENLSLLLHQRAQPLGLLLADSPIVCSGLATLTLAVEVLHPLALFSKRAAMILVPSGVAMLLGSWLLLGIPFWPLLALQVFWTERFWDQKSSATASRNEA